MNIKQINCPLPRRIFARFLDTFFCMSLVFFLSLLVINNKLISKDIRSISLTQTEMIIISNINLICLICYFVIIPMIFNGQTMTKYFFNIYCHFKNKKKIQYEIIYKELFLTILPSITTIFIPLVFTENEFKELFKGKFLDNWNNIWESLPFRIVFFIYSSIFFISVIVIFISKSRKSIYDYFANTWIYIIINDDKKTKINTSKKHKKIIGRPGQFISNILKIKKELEDTKSN